jgi:heparan-alpha-glucosaminide N-acetyltransferase
MVGMILVDNMGGSAPWFLSHPEWDGLTPADFIFPAFLFIMGLAIPLAVS